MRRMQVDITEEQDRLIAARAAAVGVPKAQIIRGLLDRGLGLDAGVDARVAAIRATSGILPDAPDWPGWLASIRGTGADERLRALGL